MSEMIKKLPMEKIYTAARCFQELFMGQMESPSSWKVVKLVFLKKPEQSRLKGLGQGNRFDMSKWHTRLEKEKEPEKMSRLHMGGVNGISCQHLQVLTTN